MLADVEIPQVMCPACGEEMRVGSLHLRKPPSPEVAIGYTCGDEDCDRHPQYLLTVIRP